MAENCLQKIVLWRNIFRRATDFITDSIIVVVNNNKIVEKGLGGKRNNNLIIINKWQLNCRVENRVHLLGFFGYKLGSWFYKFVDLILSNQSLNNYLLN